MAYEMHEWVCNEPITADKLNHMEQGIVEAQNDESSSDVLIIRRDEEATTSSKRVFDKTWQEVFDALKNGTRVIAVQETELPPAVVASPVFGAQNNTSNSVAPYQVAIVDMSNDFAASIVFADTADGYLYLNLGGSNA